MEVESSICLSDLVPALRWSRPQQVAEVLADPRLPAVWWSSVTLSRALGTAGLDWICDRLALLAASRWDHLPLADLLPALAIHHIDPSLPGWPEPARTAIAGLGGWHRLRRLSPGDLHTPAATPEVVIGSVLREVIGHLSAQPESAARSVPAGHPEATRPLRGAAPGPGVRPVTGSFPALGEGLAQPATGSFAAQDGSRPGTGSFPAQGDRSTSFGSRSDRPGSFGAPGDRPESFPPQGDRPGSFPAQSDRPGSFPAQDDRPGAPGSFAAQGEGGPTTGSFPAQGREGRPTTGSFEGVPRRGTGPLPPSDNGTPAPPGNGAAPGGAAPQGPGWFPSVAPGRGSGPFPGLGDNRGTGSFPAVGDNGNRRPGADESRRPTGSFPAVGENGSALPQRPNPARPPAGPSVSPSSAGPLPGYPAPGSALPGAPAYPPPAAPASAPAPVPSETDHAMVRVVDSLFRSLNKLELAVAVHRLFAEDPISLRTLAHKMLVERDVLSQAQRTAEERVLHWLRSSESAPVTGHMFRLTEWLGAAATEDQLIGADPAHPVMVPSLRTPLWRVLVTLMPDRRFQDGWLVVGDLHGLQARTRRLLAAAPPDADVVELLTELGIRAHSARAWLDALPAESAHDPVASASAPPQPLPRRTPGANGHHHRGGQPIPAAEAGSLDPSAALATLSALSGGRLPAGLAGTPATPPPPLPSPSSDPRRWQRIDVTPEHLRGGPVPVPEGYATQLGMRPGTLLSVTGPGDNAIVLVWQGQQPVFDSLLPVLMRLNARPGDQVYVTVDGYRLEAQLTG